MKTIALFIMITVITISMSAQEQFKKGVYSLGGSISLSSQNNSSNGNSSSVTSFTFLPSGSYFIIDQIELTIGPTYLRESSGPTFTTLGLDLGIRYYFSNDKFTPFIGAGTGMRWSAINGNSYSLPTTNIGVIGGIEAFLSNSVALEPAISYSYVNMSANSMTINGIQFRVGIKYFILP